MNEQIRLAILGCGAITREGHLPAVVAHPGVRLIALVDLDLKRAEALRQAYGLDCHITNDHRAVIGEVEAVINALPNHLHAPVTQQAVRAGIHVSLRKALQYILGFRMHSLWQWQLISGCNRTSRLILIA